MIYAYLSIFVHAGTAILHIEMCTCHLHMYMLEPFASEPQEAPVETGSQGQFTKAAKRTAIQDQNDKHITEFTSFDTHNFTQKESLNEVAVDIIPFFLVSSRISDIECTSLPPTCT